MKFEKINKLSEELNFLLKCGIAYFQSYIEYLKTPEEKLKKTWNTKIKPLILKKYPVQKSGIFNVNADVEFLIGEIDKMNDTKNASSNSNNNEIKSRLYDIRLNTIYISSKHIINKNKSKNNNNSAKNNNDNNQNKINNSNNASKNTKNESSVNPFELMKKELAVNMKLIKKNKEQKKNNKFLSIEKEFNIINCDDKRRNNSLEEQKTRIISLGKPFDPYKYVIENSDKNDKKNSIISLDNNKTVKKTEVTPTYVDVFETAKTIVYKNKELKKININLLLKKIITTDFMEKYAKNIYYFSQQCFCFINKETLFQKIINCYKFYKELDLPFNQLIRLIQFLDLLIIEMYEYYTSVTLDDKGIQIIKQFYHYLENEVKEKLGIPTSDKDKGSILLERFLYGDEDKNGEKNKKMNKIDEKIKIMGKMVDRLKSNQNTKNGIIEKKEEAQNKIKKEKEKDKKKNSKKEEEEILEEIKQVMSLLEYEEPNFSILTETKKKVYFYKLKFNLVDNKIKKKKGIKRSVTSQRTTSCLRTEKTKINNKQKNFFYINDYDPKEVGEALISISKDMLVKIERKELYKAVFLKNLKNKICPNVMECINNFNKLTSFIMEDILSYDFPKQRAKIMEAWLRVAEYLKYRNDHNDCVAIYSAIHHYIISGLNLTMKEFKSKHVKTLFKEISEYCSFEGNYKVLRENLINCLENDEYYLPYLGMLLRDISFFEANFEYVDDDLINFEKIEKIQTTIDNFFQFRKMIDIDNRNSSFLEELSFFNQLELIKEDDLEILANKIEPKFLLGDIPRRRKRLTQIDRKFFACGAVPTKYNLRNSII